METCLVLPNGLPGKRQEDFYRNFREDLMKEIGYLPQAKISFIEVIEIGCLSTWLLGSGGSSTENQWFNSIKYTRLFTDTIYLIIS